jgi:hypothetical protein
MAFGDEDLEFVMADVLSVCVVYSGQSTRGILSEGDHVVNDAELGSVQVRATTIAIKTGSLTGLDAVAAMNAAITVNGDSYKIRDVAKQDDGNITVIQIANS